MKGMDIFRLNVLTHGVMMSMKHAMKERTSVMNRWHQLIFVQQNSAQVIRHFLHIVH